MKFEFKKILKSFIVLALFILIGLIFLNFAGHMLIQEISQPLFSEDIIAVNSSSEEEKAPYFEIYNPNGKFVKLSDYHGKPLVLVFWSIWSKESVDIMGLLGNSNKLSENIFSVLFVNVQDNKSEVENFLKRGGFRDGDFPIDTTGYVSELYGVKSLPSVYFIDKDGYLREKYIGIMNFDEVRQKISKYMN